VSLQGSLDTFALADVLVLLASTKKTGELHVAGNRGSGGPRNGDVQGLLWVEDGMLVGQDVARATDTATAVFELLRLQEGSFSFATGAPASSQTPEDIEVVLGEAQSYLAEWQEIEKVVPSLASWLRLAPEAPAGHVSMRAEQWSVIVAIAGGCDVASLIDSMGHGELAGCRSIKELNEAGLVELLEAAPGGQRASAFAAAPSMADGPNMVGLDELDTEEPSSPLFESAHLDTEATSVSFFDDRVVGLHDDGPDQSDEAGRRAAIDATEADPLGSVTDFDSLVTLPSRARRKSDDGLASARPGTVPEPRRTLSSVLGDQDEPQDGSGELDASGAGLPEAQALARQLATMSGGATPAVHGPGSSSVTTTGEATAEEADGDEPLNRGLLLKFLSSVRN
jgi:hypothetical protein